MNSSETSTEEPRFDLRNFVNLNGTLFVRQTKAQLRRNAIRKNEYQIASLATKRECLRLHNKKVDLGEIAEAYDVPMKNLRRWIKNGKAERKTGAGRKPADQVMETNLINWWRENNGNMTRNEFKIQARKFSTIGSKFKASKGWFDKIKKKYKLTFKPFARSA